MLGLSFVAADAHHEGAPEGGRVVSCAVLVATESTMTDTAVLGVRVSTSETAPALNRVNR